MFLLMMAALAMQTTAIAVPTPDRAMFSERIETGRVIADTDAIGLCADDEGQATADMERIAVGMLLPKTRMLPLCTFRIEGAWRVVRKIADRCLAIPGQEWCEVEAHTVLVENGARRRYAVIVMTAAQFE